MQLRIITLLIAVSFSTSSIAATSSVSVSIPSLTGTYNQFDSLYTSGSGIPAVWFDLGVQFTTVTSLSLDWTATTTTGSYRWCDASVGSCYVSPFEIGSILARVENYDTEWGAWSGAGGGALDPTATNNPLNPLGLEGYGFPTGTGRVSLMILEEIPGFVLTDATIDISNVRLNVEGTVVPLPAALPLIMSGLTGLLFFQRKRKLA